MTDRKIQAAIQAVAPSLREIAAELGVSHQTVLSWKAGRRAPTLANREKLAALVKKRGEGMEAIADGLLASQDVREG